MKKYFLKLKKLGYISIEIVIIAAIMLVSGFTAVGSFVEDGQKATNDAASKIDETLNLAGGGLSGEFPGGSGQTPNIPVSDKLEGDGQEFHKMAPATLTFRSEADFSDFQEVQIDGETVDPAYYTVSEGSTIVTLYIDYLKTLSANEHTISIISKTGAPTGTFTVVEPETNEHGFYYNQPYTAYIESWGQTWVFFFREDNSMDLLVLESGYIEVASYTSEGNNLNAIGVAGVFTGTVLNNGNEIYCNELATTFKLGDESIAADEDYIYVYDSSLGGYVVHAIDDTQASYGPIKSGINGKPTLKLVDYMFCNNTNMVIAPKIPASVTTIGLYAFSDCASLESITIPDSVILIESRAFDWCEALTDVYYEGTEAEWNAISISNVNNDALTNATIHFNSTGPTS